MNGGRGGSRGGGGGSDGGGASTRVICVVGALTAMTLTPSAVLAAAGSDAKVPSCVDTAEETAELVVVMAISTFTEAEVT